MEFQGLDHPRLALPEIEKPNVGLFQMRTHQTARSVSKEMNLPSS
jgi:hypothetical protein